MVSREKSEKTRPKKEVAVLATSYYHEIIDIQGFSEFMLEISEGTSL